jgi:cytoskeletal protein CcmA (bactofilin family)
MNDSADGNAKRVSLLSPSSDLKGEFVTDEELVILGRVSGKRVQAPAITIGPGAQVKADIYTSTIRVEGVVVGDIYAEVSVIVQASATVRGTIHCPSITIREGASINGGANVKAVKAAADRDTGKPAARNAAARRA